MVIKFTGWTYLDPMTALLMAGYIGWMGTRLVRKAASGLMGEQNTCPGHCLPGNRRDIIIRIARKIIGRLSSGDL